MGYGQVFWSANKTRFGIFGFNQNLGIFPIESHYKFIFYTFPRVFNEYLGVRYNIDMHTIILKIGAKL